MKNEPIDDIDSLFAGVEEIYSPSLPLFKTNLPVDTYTLRPMTSKMLLTGYAETDDVWRIMVDGQLVSSVRMVGKMINKQMSDASLSFTLHDGTGGVDVYFWIEDGNDFRLLAAINEGDYVMMCGKPTAGNTKEDALQVRAYVVRAISNHNDVTHHFLYCIYAHLDALKTNAKKAKAIAAAAASSSSVRASAPIIPGSVPLTGKTEIRILEILRDPAYKDIEHGVSFNLLSRLLVLTTKEISRAVDVLLDVGAAFTTVSDHHIKASMV